VPDENHGRADVGGKKKTVQIERILTQRPRYARSVAPAGSGGINGTRPFIRQQLLHT
jgi:hypothetical protein